MSPLKPLSLFFVKLVCLYLLFVVVWEFADGQRWYPAAFQSAGSTFFRAFEFGDDDGGRVHIDELDTPNNLWDSELRFANLKTGAKGAQPFSSRYWGYAPTTMVLTLILATPVSWKRRGWAMLAGLALVHLWIGLECWLSILNGFSGANDLAIYFFSSAPKKVLATVTEFVTVSTVTRFVVPVFIWVLVTFRRQDLEEALVRTGVRDRARDESASSSP